MQQDDPIVCGLNVRTKAPVSLGEMDLQSGIVNMFEIPGKLNLGWICAAINSLSSILFCFVYFKLCHIIFTKHQPRNWLTISIYLLIIIDLVVGCGSITSVILQDNVYQTSTRTSVKPFSLVLLSMQKGLFSVIVLTQIFEWSQLTMFLWFQMPRRVKLEELVGLKNYYNKLEWRYFYLHILVILLYGFFQYLIDVYAHEFSQQ